MNILTLKNEDIYQIKEYTYSTNQGVEILTAELENIPNRIIEVPVSNIQKITKGVIINE